MKLQTMLLPTGEFIIVGSEARPQPSATHLEMLRDAIKTVKAETGAAAFFLTDDVVEVENATIDENACRRLPAPEPLQTSDESWEIHQHFPRVEFDVPTTEIGEDGAIKLTGRAVSSGWIDIGKVHKETLEAFFGGPVDETSDGKVYAAVQVGADFTPAGLVDTREHPELRTTAELEPELAEALAGRPGRTERVVSESGVQFFREGQEIIRLGADGDNFVIEERPVEPTPKPGDTVRIVGPSSWHQEKGILRDTIGKVADSNKFPEHGILVEFTHPVHDSNGRDGNCRWYFPAASLEVLRG